MQSVTMARNKIGPLLDQLICELEAEGLSTQQRYFHRIRQDFNRARDKFGLTATMVELSSCTALGLQLPGTADALMSRILEKVSELTQEIDGSPPTIH